MLQRQPLGKLQHLVHVAPGLDRARHRQAVIGLDEQAPLPLGQTERRLQRGGGGQQAADRELADVPHMGLEQVFDGRHDRTPGNGITARQQGDNSGKRGSSVAKCAIQHPEITMKPIGASSL
ncbi:hypothetical protein D3C87_1393930 [compost metagenome]